MKRRRLFRAVLLVAVLSTLSWLILREPPEPVYNGKPLSVWLEEYFKKSGYPQEMSGIYESGAPEAENAIRRIGLNAIPTLLRLAGEHRFRLKTKVARWLQTVPWLHFRATTDDHALAAAGFYVLGPLAKSAVPALIDMLKQGDYFTQNTASDCLGNIGPDAEPAIPILIQRASQTNNIVQWSATRALGGIHRRPDLVVPVLITNLSAAKTAPQLQLPGLPGTAAYSLWALGNYGVDAKSAVSAILPYLTDPDLFNRTAATYALKQIDPEAAAKAGIR